MTPAFDVDYVLKAFDRKILDDTQRAVASVDGYA